MNFVVGWPRLRRWYDTPPEPEPEPTETLEERTLRLMIEETIREDEKWWDETAKEIREEEEAVLGAGGRPPWENSEGDAR